MPANITPRNSSILRALADGLIRGCQQYEGEIGIKQNTAEVLGVALNEAVAAEMEAGRCLKARSDAYAEVAAADKAGLGVLTGCKLNLVRFHGARWNSGWEAAGFPDRSTAVPRTMDPRYVLLSSLALYFAEHPQQQCADMDATAALCAEAQERLRAARHAAARSESALTSAFRRRRAAFLALRKRVRGLKCELWALMEGDDPRWLAFGLNIPARAATPERIEQVTAEPVGAEMVVVSWPFASRSTRTRIEARVVGVDDDFRHVRTVKGLQVVLRGFSAGQAVEIRATAANETGEAPPSEVVRVTLEIPSAV